MQKLEITVVVPERIAALVQHYIQVNILGKGKQEFGEYLDDSGVENPEQYIPEMEIGIKHPDDVEQLYISNHSEQDNLDIFTWLSMQNDIASYFDFVTNQNVYSIYCLDEINAIPPQHVLDFIESVKATGCSYFRFIK